MKVMLEIYDIRGRKIKSLFDGFTAPGLNRFRWNGQNEMGEKVAGGIYFVRLKSSAALLKAQKNIYLK
jgi:flagellar hook assembly protein FlgD